MFALAAKSSDAFIHSGFITPSGLMFFMKLSKTSLMTRSSCLVKIFLQERDRPILVRLHVDDGLGVGLEPAVQHVRPLLYDFVGRRPALRHGCFHRRTEIVDRPEVAVGEPFVAEHRPEDGCIDLIGFQRRHHRCRAKRDGLHGYAGFGGGALYPKIRQRAFLRDADRFAVEFGHAFDRRRQRAPECTSLAASAGPTARRSFPARPWRWRARPPRVRWC